MANFKKSFNGSIGKSLEGKMFSKLANPSGPATATRIGSDGSRTLLKTGAGFARFIHEPGKEDVASEFHRVYGEPRYNPKEAAPDTAMHIIKVDLLKGTVSTSKIPLDKYEGTDVEESGEFLRYRRNHYWTNRLKAEDARFLHFLGRYTVGRPTMFGDRHLNGVSYPLAENGAVSTSAYPLPSSAYGVFRFEHNTETKDWLLCATGVTHHPLSEQVDPFVIGDWLGYDETVNWDDWYEAGLQHNFFSPDGSKLILCNIMPVIADPAPDSGPITYRIPGIYVYDVVANAVNPLMLSWWYDTYDETASEVAVDTPPIGVHVNERHSVIDMSIHRNITLSSYVHRAADYPTTPDTLNAVYLDVSLDVNCNLNVSSPTCDSSRSMVSDFKWYVGTDLIWQKTKSMSMAYGYEYSADITIGNPVSTAYLGVNVTEFGFLARPEQSIYVLVEYEHTIPDSTIISGNPNPLPHVKMVAHVYDAIKKRLWTVSSPDLISINWPLNLGSCPMMNPEPTWSYSTVINGLPYVSACTKSSIASSSGITTFEDYWGADPEFDQFPDTSFNYLHEHAFQQWDGGAYMTTIGGSTTYDPADDFNRTEDMGAFFVNRYWPFPFDKPVDDDPDVYACVDGSIMADNKVIMVSVKCPYTMSQGAIDDFAITHPDERVCDGYFLNFVIDRKRGTVIRGSSTHGYKNLYERITVI